MESLFCAKPLGKHLISINLFNIILYPYQASTITEATLHMRKMSLRIKCHSCRVKWESHDVNTEFSDPKDEG